MNEETNTSSDSSDRPIDKIAKFIIAAVAALVVSELVNKAYDKTMKSVRSSSETTPEES